MSLDGCLATYTDYCLEGLIDKSFMALLEREAAMHPGGIEVKHSNTTAGTGVQFLAALPLV